MKTAMDVVKGRIVGVDEYGVVTIKAKYDDLYTMIKRGYRECNIQMIDSRTLSDQQRRACYAMIREISDFTGMGTDSAKQYTKLKFLAEDFGETADKIFSLSNAPMSLVCAYQKWLVRFILDWDIPTKKPLLNFVDDVDDYIYACLTAKKCCICGRTADLHHVDAVGSGRDRTKIIHEGMHVLPLCRMHHTEIHTMTDAEIENKFHIPSKGIPLDKALCRIYRLKYKKEEQENAEQSTASGTADKGH